MAEFRIDSIAGLARQMGFTPREARLAQLGAAEGLLQELDPAKAYPLDFVVFRITGYHPKQVTQDLLTGLALQHDLGLLVERVSEGMGLCVEAISEPVLSIDDVTVTFNVTSKTIQRWRRRGLPARRFVFPDGKRRVGFLLSSVERFLAAHREQVAQSGNFTVVEQAEEDEIVRRARRLAVEGRCWPEEIARRVGRRVGRSPLTVLHVLRRHDQMRCAEAVLPLAGTPLSEQDRAMILKGFRRGVSVSALAKRLGRPRWAIYRTLLEGRMARVGRKKTRFIDDELYHQPEAGAAIDAIVKQGALGPGGAGNGNGTHDVEGRAPKDLPPYLQDLYRTPLLTPAEERGLFLKFNFHKYQFVTARRRLDVESASRRNLDELERYLRLATETKNAIVRANLRLVVSVARKHLRCGLGLMELVSDGNLTLMRAVESFDVHKGNRFSTYATLALMKGFARSVPEMMQSRLGGTTADERVLAEVADPRPRDATQRFFEREHLQHMLSRLEDRERRVLLAHYGLAGGAGNGRATSSVTYQQVGRSLGISTQRVRQIERVALAKLRAAVSIGE
jgi:RNA polymerase sigma factor (sigma-70 family)